MRRSNLSRRPRGNVDTKSFALKGGINLVDAPLTIPDGMCLAAINYELLTTDGYRRIDGFERYDGQVSPSDASYWLLNYYGSTAAISEGDTVTGLSSGVTGVCLIDKTDQTSNLLTYSEQFDHASWVKTRVTVTPNVAAAPDTTVTADKIICDGTADPFIRQLKTLSISEGNKYTFSVWAWTDSGQPTDAELFIYGNDFSTDTMILSESITLTTTATRYDITITAPAGVTSTQLTSRIDLTQTPSAGNYIYAWGAQVEEAATAGTYVKTVTTAGAGGYLILTAVTGSYTDNEDLQVSAATVAFANGDTLERGATTPADDAIHAQDAIETQRALITKVGAADGSGPVRGVHVYNGDVYAFRDNTTATKCLMWKSTTSGWVEQSLGNIVHFTAGTAEMFDGETLTQTGTTATILRVVKQSGTWGSDAAGYLIIDTVTSGPYAAGVATTSLGSVTLSGAEAANELANGGRYEFENYNFFGATKTKRMYGVNGVSEAFEWDGSVFVPIITGNTVDTPTHLAVNEYHLQLAFANGSLQNSDTGTPYVWAGGGAAEIGCGDDIVGLKKEVGGALVIICRNRAFALHGKNTTALPWDLKTVSEESGGIEWTVQRLRSTKYLDDGGFTDIAAVQEFGDFKDSVYSQVIEPLVTEKKNLAISSIIVKRKSQYRLFFSDGTAIIATFKNNKLSGFTTIQYVGSDNNTVVANCTANGEDANGEEILFFGDTSGYVYQMDKGTSFDGGPVSATIIMSYSHVGSPSYDKQFKKVLIEADGSTGTTIQYNVLLDYSSGRAPAGITLEKELTSGGSYWNNTNWNTFFWAAEDVTLIEGDIDGVGRNIGLQITSSSTYTEPHILYGITYNYILRKLVR